MSNKNIRETKNTLNISFRIKKEFLYLLPKNKSESLNKILQHYGQIQSSITEKKKFLDKHKFHCIGGFDKIEIIEEEFAEFFHLIGLDFFDLDKELRKLEQTLNLSKSLG